MLRVCSKFLVPLAKVAAAGVAYKVVHGSYHQRRLVDFNCTTCEPKVPSYKDHFVGEVIMTDGSKFIGIMQDGKRWGVGESWDMDGHYKGDWVDNFKCGSGVFTHANGSIYEGNFANDLPNGQGKLTLRDGRVFEGEFVNGALQGQPRITCNDSDAAIMDGEFYEGEGIGQTKNLRYTYTLQDGRVWEGEVVDGEANGYGQIIGPDGSKVVGKFAGGLLNGIVRTYYPDGSHEICNFVEGKRNGEAIMKTADGLVFEDFIVNDVFHGMRSILAPDGTMTERELIHGVLQKATKRTFPDGYTVEGNLVLHDAKQRTESFHGTVKEIFPNEDDDLVSVCELFHGIRHGPRKLTFASGVVVEGEYKCGVRYGKWTETFPDGTTTVTDFTPDLRDRLKLLALEQLTINLPKLQEEVTMQLDELKQKWTNK